MSAVDAHGSLHFSTTCPHLESQRQSGERSVRARSLTVAERIPHDCSERAVTRTSADLSEAAPLLNVVPNSCG